MDRQAVNDNGVVRRTILDKVNKIKVCVSYGDCLE